MRPIKIAVVLVVAGFAGVAGARGQGDVAAFQGLQKAVQKAIQQNDASIACILVSRSEKYEDFGQGPDKDRPGRLGSFDVKMLDRAPRFSDLTADQQKQWRKQLDFTDPGYVPRAFGSGVVVDASGLILTNYHVVQDATKIFVRLPGGKGSYADIHAADPRCDLAVLKLLAPHGLLRPITLGDADTLERGQFVLTLSNPFAAGFRDGQPSASFGILSNIRRRAAVHLKEEERVKPFHYFGTLLQTDTRMHVGSSGGALLNLQGEMVGLITSLAAIQGIDAPGGFAVPITPTMRRIIDVLKRGEEVDYGFLGVGFDPPDGSGNGKIGVRLTYVGEGTPAKIDGDLVKDDVLLAVNGRPIHDSDDLYLAIGTHLAGGKIQVTFQRGLTKRNVDITLAKLHVPGKPIVSSLGSRPYFRGLRVDYGSLFGQQQPNRPGAFAVGVFVSDVQPNTSADRANIKAGDLITHVNQQRVSTPAAFYQAVDAAKGPLELTLYNIPPTKVLLKVK